MSRGRRQVIQLNEPPPMLYSNEPANENEDDDDDSAGDMPTPERLVTEDMLPGRSVPVNSGGYEIDNKVANFLAEIDALEPTPDGEASSSSAPVHTQDATPPHRDQYSPARERSPVRTKVNAYSNMFVKGTPEFVKKQEDVKGSRDFKKIEPWPEEPKTEWQQLTDEKTNYPYYWNVNTNQVVWDMPPEFSQYLLRQKEYEEKVERGLSEGTLDPSQRGKPSAQKQEQMEQQTIDTQEVKKSTRSSPPRHRRPSHSEDSSSDSSDSDGSPARDSRRDIKRSTNDKAQEVSSSSAENSRAASNDKKRSATPELPDSTKPDDKKVAAVKADDQDDSMDFDIDDIDKELEMALERKRQELMKLEDKKKDEKSEDKHKEKERKKDEHRHRDEHRKHGKHRDLDRERDRDRDRDRDRKRHHDEEKKPKLTLKERLRIEMELKMEKEKRKKRAIEELMARELEQTVGSRHKRHRDDRDKGYKRYRRESDYGDLRSSRDDYDEYGDYDSWGTRGSMFYDDRYGPPQSMKPPPPTEEMIAYEAERRSQVVDYGHGRSRGYDGDSDGEDIRTVDAKDLEMKKLEALQLAELALSKLEFLEVTKKGLSKLQILLIELETRHQDWQAGGLTTNHFLSKLQEANWQLEQYEASAAPAGWACSWDRYKQFLIVL